MNSVKYVGMDVHKAITVIVALNALGRKLSATVHDFLEQSCTVTESLQSTEAGLIARLFHFGDC